MAKTFTKEDLQTGDIIETRNGEFGVVILEKDCILYQAGGLDCLDIFTEDLFVDGVEREGDIFKVYSDPEGPIGFNKRFGIDPVFRRKNDKKTKMRAAELNEQHDPKKGNSKVMILEPCFRKIQEQYVNKRLEDMDIDIALSEAPSMTVCGQIEIDRTYIPVPHAENLYILYNKYQEKWHLENAQQHEEMISSDDEKPMVIIPEENLRIFSRCMVIRKNDSDMLEDLQEDDFEKVRAYLHNMA
ncbi:MAG: hypothetical protein IJG52_05115 [Lachnospiraceae bacterium]|nr:hypothetical protein [Lachnospiraceae bacterium]